MRRTLALTLLLLAGSAPPALAGGRLVVLPSDPPTAQLEYGAAPELIAGPRWVGGSLAWVGLTSDGYDLHLTSEDGADRRLKRFRVPVGPQRLRSWGADLEASGSRLVLSLRVTKCGLGYGGVDCYAHASFNGIYTARASGRVLRLAGCRSVKACKPCPGRDAATVDVAGGDVLYTDGCSDEVFLARVGRAPIVTTKLPVGSVRLSDRFLVNQTYAGGLRVIDRRTGKEVYGVPTPPHSWGIAGVIALQPDGKVAFAQPEEFEPGCDCVSDHVEWASPSDPTPHVMGDLGYRTDVRMAADRVAFTHRRTIRVMDLAGEDVASAPAFSLYGREAFDFDGRRLAFTVRACERFAVAVWDLAGTPPGFPAGSCPVPRISSADGRLRASAVPVWLSCPARGSLGCRGRMKMIASARRPGSPRGGGSRGQYLLGTSQYSVPPGTTRLMVFQPSEDGKHYLERHRRVWVDAYALSPYRVDTNERSLLGRATFALRRRG